MILDKATGIIDSNSEKLIQDAAKKITKGRTSIVIAHRLAAIQKADCILLWILVKLLKAAHTENY